MRIPSNFRRFLAIPGVPRLLASAIVMQMPLAMLPLAILLLIRAETDSFALAGLAVGAFTLANAGVAPALGMLVDRLGQPAVLAACAVGQSAVLLVLAMAARGSASEALLVGLATLAGASMPPSLACVRAIWREIARDGSMRDAAYALDSVILECAWIVGPLLVVAMVAVASPPAAVVLCAACTAGGTAAFVTSPFPRRLRGGPRPGSRWGALHSPGLRWLLCSVFLVGLWWGVMQVGLPALALDIGASWATGGLLALISVGAVVGGLWYGARAWQLPIADRYWVSLLLLALLFAPLVAAQSLGAAIPLSLLAGIALIPMVACQTALVGGLATAGTVTEAFTWSTAATWGGIAIGSAGSGSLVAAAGVDTALIAGSSAVALGGLLALLGRRRITVPDLPPAALGDEKCADAPSLGGAVPDKPTFARCN